MPSGTVHEHIGSPYQEQVDDTDRYHSPCLQPKDKLHRGAARVDPGLSCLAHEATVMVAFSAPRRGEHDVNAMPK